MMRALGFQKSHVLVFVVIQAFSFALHYYNMPYRSRLIQNMQTQLMMVTIYFNCGRIIIRNYEHDETKVQTEVFSITSRTACKSNASSARAFTSSHSVECCLRLW